MGNHATIFTFTIPIFTNYPFKPSALKAKGSNALTSSKTQTVSPVPDKMMRMGDC